MCTAVLDIARSRAQPPLERENVTTIAIHLTASFYMPVLKQVARISESIGVEMLSDTHRWVVIMSMAKCVPSDEML